MKKLSLWACLSFSVFLAFPYSSFGQTILKQFSPGLRTYFPTCKQSLDKMISNNFSQTWVYRSDAETFLNLYFDTCPTSDFNTGSLDTAECHEAKNNLGGQLFQIGWDFFAERCHVEPNTENPSHDIMDCSDYIKETLGFNTILGLLGHEASLLPKTNPDLNNTLISKIQTAETACNCGNGVKEFYEECDPSVTAQCTSSCKFLKLPSISGKAAISPKILAPQDLLQ